MAREALGLVLELVKSLAGRKLDLTVKKSREVRKQKRKSRTARCYISWVEETCKAAVPDSGWSEAFVHMGRNWGPNVCWGFEVCLWDRQEQHLTISLWCPRQRHDEMQDVYTLNRHRLSRNNCGGEVRSLWASREMKEISCQKIFLAKTGRRSLMKGKGTNESFARTGKLPRRTPSPFVQKQYPTYV